MTLWLTTQVDVIRCGIFTIELQQGISGQYYKICMSSHPHPAFTLEIFNVDELESRWGNVVEELPILEGWLYYMNIQTDAFITGLVAL